MRYPWPGYGYGWNDACYNYPPDYFIIIVDYNYRHDLYYHVIKKRSRSEKFLLGHWGNNWKDRC